jgi:hypothetical protein
MSSSRLHSFARLGELVHAREAPTVVAVDGRSASGKSTFAATLATAINAPVVHSDDVAWHHSFFEWWPLLVEHVIVPFRSGSRVEWTPPAWVEHGRTGSIVVAPGPVLIVEGVGTTRRELAPHIDVPIWVETSVDVAETRGSERDGPEGRDFWFEWQASERPFLESDRPWKRAELVVDGAPTVAHDRQTHFVALNP